MLRRKFAVVTGNTAGTVWPGMPTHSMRVFYRHARVLILVLFKRRIEVKRKGEEKEGKGERKKRGLSSYWLP